MSRAAHRRPDAPGPLPQDLTRLGSSRVLRGNGLVAKSGSSEGIAREAFLFGEAAALLPVGTPTLVASGPDRLLMEDVGGEPASPEDVTPLAQLALVHESFVGATGIRHERFCDVFGREREGRLALARGSANAAALPEPLSGLADYPLLLDEDRGRRAANVVYGDAWSGNVLMRGKDFVWLDWSDPAPDPPHTTSRRGSTARQGAGVGQPRGRAGRVPGGADDEGGAFQLQARGGRVRDPGFRRRARTADHCEPDLIERVIQRGT